jgi:hypothetical protein
MSDGSGEPPYAVRKAHRRWCHSCTRSGPRAERDSRPKRRRVGTTEVTIGYFDAAALATILAPGEAGDRGAALWASFDAACTQQFSEIEVPSRIGRQLDRMAWVWALNSLSVVGATDQLHTAAVDLAWLGAPPSVALHVAAAELTAVDHYVTSDAVAASWAAARGLDVISL